MGKSMTADLTASGLTPSDMGTQLATPAHLAAIRVPSSTEGYIIPYFMPNGARMKFYRVKLFDFTLKYKQAVGTSNHIYFPPQFHASLSTMLEQCHATGDIPYLIITEGEKKAASACAQGIPCVALGGVDNWRNRTLILPADTELDSNRKDNKCIRAKLPSGTITTLTDYALAVGFQELIDILAKFKLTAIIIFDTDEADGLKLPVQRAAASLAHQIVYMGMSIMQVRQALLPYEGQKIGLDDYLLNHSITELHQLCQTAALDRKAFPGHPNARQLINGKLQKGKLSRKEIQEVSMTMLAELDASGRRLRNSSDTLPYYFDENTHTLMPAQMIQKQGEPMHESPFGRYLYRRFGVSTADSRVLTWLAAQFTGEAPIEDVEPRRVVAICPNDPNEIALQISDSHFAVVSGDIANPLRIYTNGQYGLLFEQEQVAPTKGAELEEHFYQQLNAEKFNCWWLDVFENDVNLSGDEHVQKMAALLYYISPWLLRWRGTQLPAELLIGEAGSGKSSLYELRLSIMTGEPLLRNIPSDLKDWFASIVNTGGLHVIDNVQFTNKDLRQRLSDEMCRIITEPKPHIEMRRLYTTSGQFRLPVNTVFAMTAIQQPFYNADIIQRAAIFELGAISSGHDSNWVQTQLDRFGGRTAWIAHHLVFLHKFLNKVQEGGWKSEYKAEHRLANYEQCLQVTARIFGLDAHWIPKALSSRTRDKITEADWTLEGLKDFVYEMLNVNPNGFTFGSLEIAQWSEGHEEHCKNPQLCNSRSLGRYLTSHSATIYKTVGITGARAKNNRKMFQVDPKKMPKEHKPQPLKEK